MFKKSICFIIVVLLFNITTLYANSTSNKKQSEYNAYPTNLYYNGEKVGDAYIYQNTTFLPLRTLSESMGYTVDYKSYPSSYNDPLRITATITTSNDTDKIVLNARDEGVEVYKNGEKLNDAYVLLIDKGFIDNRINFALKKGYLTSETDNVNYLKKDTIYINIRTISELFDCTVNYDKSANSVYISG